MKRRAILALATLTLGALGTGCGFHSYNGYDGPRGGGGGGGGGVPVDPTAAFVIDPGAGVNLPDLAYAVTTNGLDWTLAWTGDAAFHRFEGELIGAGTLSRVQFANGFQGDVVRQVEAGRVQFDANTDGSLNQSITLRSDTQPMRFNLYIDGQAAVGAVAFMSQGRLSTTDSMPFDLLTPDQVQAKGATVTQARALPEPAAAAASAAGKGARFIPAPGAAVEDKSR